MTTATATEANRLDSKVHTVSPISDSLVGVLLTDADEKKTREERISRYE